MSVALAVVKGDLKDANEDWTPEKPKIIKKSPYYNLIAYEDQRLIDCTNVKEDLVKRHINYTLVRHLGHSEVRSYSNKFPLPVLAKFYNDLVNDALENFDIEAIKYLVGLIKQHHDERQKEVQERLASGKVEFIDLELLFEKGAKVVSTRGDTIAGWVEKVQESDSFWFKGMFVSIRVIHNAHGELDQGLYKAAIPKFAGLMDISDLPVELLDADTEVKLLERGKRYMQHMKPGSYARYTGELLVPTWRNTQTFRATGRVIVDPSSFSQISPETYRDCVSEGMPESERDGDDKGEYQPDESDLWAMFPYTLGFSFTAKRWGILKCDDLLPIEWREDAFEKLVLPDEEKSLVKALVAHHGGSFEDIIDGKGGGCIFLLHGEPGQGKTLTAEAVAELLHRPLYAISVGELGTDPDELESSLRKILDVAMTWNAVLLLDEADIFLEARDEKDIVRNAMVGVFLRLLEYHQGVMFLTTNRVKNIDRAFYSRISVALKFEDAGEEKRRRIWENLLGAAKIEGLDINKLAKEHLNGRQIKNTIRLSQTLARSEGKDVSDEHIQRTIRIARNFEVEMQIK